MLGLEIEYLQAENAILRSHSPIILFSPYSAPASPAPMMAEWVVNQDTLRQILGMADVDLSDLDFVNDQKHQLPPRERARAEQVVNAAAFRHWITAPSSTKLMVHWDQCRQVANVSSLTALCATMAAALKGPVGALPVCTVVLWTTPRPSRGTVRRVSGPAGDAQEPHRPAVEAVHV